MNYNFRNAYRRGKQTVKRLIGLEPNIGTQIHCIKEYHGAEYCDWCICPVSLNQDSVVYSFGVGEDISFDLAIIKKFGVTIHAFDPTPKSINWVKAQQVPPEFRLYEYGIADFDGIIQFNPPENPEHVSYTILDRPGTAVHAIDAPVYTLETILHKLGHDHIDVLKMDVEGAEYGVIKNLVASNIKIDQLLVEFHHRFGNVTINETKTAISLLNNAGFKIFNISPSGEEYSFIQEHVLV